MLPENYEDSEAPLADTIQVILAVLFFITWGVDSFWFKWTIGYTDYVSNYFRTGVFLILLFVGGYLTWKAHELIFGTVRQEAELVQTSVFSYSRHPMYLGIMIMYLGLAISSLSIASFLLLVVIFFFYNYLASYEEKQLIAFFGESYIGYMKKTRRWL